jgi:hypothetical protein
MTDENKELDLTADDLRVRDAVRALSRPEADAGFRAQLREGFVSGSFDTAPRETVRRGAPAPLPMWRKLAPIAVGVAALILLVVPYVRTPGLNLLGIRGANQIVLNGEIVTCGDLNPIRAALLPGCRIQAPEGAVMQFAREGELVMDLEGMEFTFPGPPLPLVGRAMRSSVEGDGTIRMATAPGFAGRSYRLRVGDADLVIRDSVFTVSRTGDEIGISVLEGELEAVMPDGHSETVGPRSGAMIRSGQFMKKEFDPDETELLQTLRDRAIVI